MIKLKREAEFGQLKGFSVRADGTLMMGHILCVPDVGELKKEIMEEAHSSAYAMHPGSTKMYHPEGTLLVEGYKERCCRVCLQMSHLSASQG